MRLGHRRDAASGSTGISESRGTRNRDPDSPEGRAIRILRRSEQFNNTETMKRLILGD
jgi:hypothetical protein